MSFSEVAVSVPLYPHKRFFDYKIPEELWDSLRVGQMVLVPFGKRKTWGIVWKIKAEADFSSDPKKIKNIEALLFEKEVFSEPRLLFAEWLCDRYFYPIGEVFETMLPAAILKASQNLINAKAKLEAKAAFIIRELNYNQ